MDLTLLALAKGYTDKQIEKAEMGGIQLDRSLTKEGFAADAKAVGEAISKTVGAPGPEGPQGPQGEPGISGVHVGTEPPTDDTANVWINTDESASVSDFIQSPSTASIGQTIVVKAVDENSKPTEWEVVDLPSGSSGDRPIELMRTVTIPADIATDTSGVIWSQSAGDTTKPYKFEVDIEPLKYLVMIYKGSKEGSTVGGTQSTTKLIGNIECETLTTAFTASTVHGRAALLTWDGYTVLQTTQGTTWGELNWVSPRVDASIPPTVGLTEVSKIVVWNWENNAYWAEGTTFDIYGVRA